MLVDIPGFLLEPGLIRCYIATFVGFGNDMLDVIKGDGSEPKFHRRQNGFPFQKAAKAADSSRALPAFTGGQLSYINHISI